MQLRQMYLSLIAMAVLVGWLVVPQVAGAAKPTGVSGPNQVLLAAASPFEDLTEFALANDTRGMRQALKAYGDQAAAVNKVLSVPARREMASLLAAIRRAESKGDNQEVALNSVEAYRVLVESLDPNGLVVPIQVSKLDYVGFKLKVLLAASPPDWPAIQTTIEARGSPLARTGAPGGRQGAARCGQDGDRRPAPGDQCQERRDGRLCGPDGPGPGGPAGRVLRTGREIISGLTSRPGGWLSRLRLTAEITRPGRAARSSQALPRETYGEKACRYRGV